MGCRIHVVKQQEDYGTAEGFNYKHEEFDSLLSTLGCDTNPSEDYSRNECLVSEYESALNILKEYKEHGKSPEVEELCDDACAYLDDALEDINKLFNNLDEAITLLQAYYNQRDKNSEYIQFVAW